MVTTRLQASSSRYPSVRIDVSRHKSAVEVTDWKRALFQSPLCNELACTHHLHLLLIPDRESFDSSDNLLVKVCTTEAAGELPALIGFGNDSRRSPFCCSRSTLADNDTYIKLLTIYTLSCTYGRKHTLTGPTHLNRKYRQYRSHKMLAEE